MKDRSEKYGKSYLRDYKHGVVRRADLENMRIVRASWFDSAELEVCTLLKTNLKNKKNFQWKVNEYIKKKLDAKPLALYRYHLHYIRSITLISWKVEEIYKYFIQMKTDMSTRSCCPPPLIMLSVEVVKYRVVRIHTLWLACQLSWRMRVVYCFFLRLECFTSICVFPSNRMVLCHQVARAMRHRKL